MPIVRPSLRPWVLLTTLALLAGGLLVAPANAAPEGVQVPPDQAGHLLTWGNGDNGLDTIPAGIADSPVVAVSGGVFHSIALTADGRVATWGANGYGQATVPGPVAATTVTAVAAGATFNVVLTQAGDLIAWGNDDYGQTAAPTAPSGETFTAIAAGGYHGLALTDAGDVVGWGLNGNGQATPPPEIQGHTVAIAAGDGFSLALTDDGDVHAWGNNANDQATIPPEVDAANIVAISAGDFHALALTDDGHVLAWGRADEGQTTLPAGLDDDTVTAIAAGGRYSLVLTADNQVIGWGQNFSGQTTIPASVDNSTVLTIAAGYSQALAIVAAVVSTGQPTVSGVPGLGQTLTVSPAGYNVAPDSISYQWYADGAPVDGATGTTFVPGAAQVGTHITVAATATKAGYASDTDLSAPVGPVAPGEFTTGPKATVIGTAHVGQALTAGTGTPVPAPDHYTYAWLVDGALVADTDNPTFTLTAAHVGHRISVQVTAVRAGYAPKADVSDQTAPVTTLTAPTLALTSDESTLRRGQPATLSWSSTGATTLTPSGEWPSSGPARLPDSGTVTVSPTTLGTHTYTLTATNDAGTATADVVITVVREATDLAVTVPAHRGAGERFRLRATTLDPGEAYTVLFGSRVLVQGFADDQGSVDRGLRVPAHAGIGRHRIAVTGASPDRTGHATLTVQRRR